MINDGLSGVKHGVRSFLLIGQSNMAGRGTVGSVPPIQNPNCLMLRMGRWQGMTEPVNPDRRIFGVDFCSGISLGPSFADEVAKLTGEKVGLIPCADGGTRIDQWMPGEILYDHAVFMTRLAMRTSTLSGILWHQGCSDCVSEEQMLAHREKFIRMITSLRRELDAEDLPLIIGEIPYNATERWNLGDRPERLNSRYAEICGELPLCGLASSRGLTLNPDGIHFDGPSLRELGLRYFNAYKELIGR